MTVFAEIALWPTISIVVVFAMYFSTVTFTTRYLVRRRANPERQAELVTLAEATPVHEAAALARDLARAEIRPFAWIINQSLAPLAVRDPVLRRRRAAEAPFHAEVAAAAPRRAVVPWRAPIMPSQPPIAAAQPPATAAPTATRS